MGQMTYAVLWGIRGPADVDFWGDDLPNGDALLQKWERECAEGVRRHAERYADKIHRFNPRAAFEPHFTYGGDDEFVGFLVAVGASGKPGTPFLRAMPMKSIQPSQHTKLGRAMIRAQRRWKRFARWCRRQGVKLKKPSLWLVETEVA